MIWVAAWFIMGFLTVMYGLISDVINDIPPKTNDFIYWVGTVLLGPLTATIILLILVAEKMFFLRQARKRKVDKCCH